MVSVEVAIVAAVVKVVMIGNNWECCYGGDDAGWWGELGCGALSLAVS